MKGIRIAAAVFWLIATIFLWVIFLSDFIPSPRSVAITAYTGCAVAWGLLALGAIKHS